MPLERIGTELSMLSGQNAPAVGDAAISPESYAASDKTGYPGMFATQPWHTLYADALIETDPARLARMIAEAEGAIRARSAELSARPEVTDESVDLQRAVAALLYLKQVNLLSDTQPHLVV